MQQPDVSIDLSLSVRPRKKSGVVEQHVLEEMVLYDSETEMGYSLNPSARTIWELCDGQRTIDVLCTVIGEQLHIEADMLFEDVKTAISHLVSLGLVSIDEQSGADDPDVPA